MWVNSPSSIAQASKKQLCIVFIRYKEQINKLYFLNPTVPIPLYIDPMKSNSFIFSVQDGGVEIGYGELITKLKA